MFYTLSKYLYIWLQIEFDLARRLSTHLLILLGCIVGIIFGSLHVQIILAVIAAGIVFMMSRTPARSMTLQENGDMILSWPHKQIELKKEEVRDIQIGPNEIYVRTRDRRKFLIAHPKLLSKKDFIHNLAVRGIEVFEDFDCTGHMD